MRVTNKVLEKEFSYALLFNSKARKAAVLKRQQLGRLRQYTTGGYIL